MSLSIDGISDSMVEAVASRAELHARLLGDALSRIFSPDELETLVLSREQLLELAAAVQLKYWEQKGITLHVENGLPCYSYALAKIEEQGRSSVSQPLQATMSNRVMRFWLERYSWISQSEWETDMIVGEIDVDQLVELMAEFLWSRRDTLFALCEDDE